MDQEVNGSKATLAENQELNVVYLDLPASHKYLNLIRACITAVMEREDGPPEQDWLIYQIELAVYEACTNIIKHAYVNTIGRINISISVEEDPRRLIIALIDTGIPFDTSQLQNIEINEPKTSGYGLFLIQELMDKVTYRSEQGKNHWRLEKEF